ncbi:MAG: DNA adenine methylase [Bacilli bacterium]|nr:DNA adenine methylase [Bacilli bacterium]
MIKGKPFVKWAGGKRQIIDKLLKYVPDEFNTYYEPFIGGGALLFELSPNLAVINDSNKELMNVYNVLCNEVKFKKMCRVLNSYETNHSEDFFYEIRNKDRNKTSFKRMSDYTRAARTIYLNKACFNGLYRVNSKNEFNVPFGKKLKVNTYDGGNLITVSNYLTMNNIKILSVDFEEAVKDAKKGDFIYFDPPYDSDTSTFNSYTEEGFNKEEQKRLARVYKELSDRGCYVMLSNHNTSLVQELYRDYNFHVIEAKRNINANGKKRGKVEEVIITNYENDRTFNDREV